MPKGERYRAQLTKRGWMVWDAVDNKPMPGTEGRFRRDAETKARNMNERGSDEVRTAALG